MSGLELRAVRSFVARYPLVMALGISLMTHGLMYGVWHLGKQHGWWQYQATWFFKLKPKSKPPAPLVSNPQHPLQPQQQPREIPLTFVEVDPVAAVFEPPKETKYYGAVNSVAANPDPVVEKPIPKVTGEQTKIVKLDHVKKPEPQPLQPSLPPEKPTPKEPTLEPKPKPAEKPGDLAMTRPSDIRIPTEGQADTTKVETPVLTKPKPRTLAEARQAKAMISGEKMKQDGGVTRPGRIAFDVKATAFGAYDAAFIAAVQQRWYDLIDASTIAPRSGKVVVEFRLYYDGRISNLKSSDNEVGEMLGLLCQRAILDPSPYPKWPSDMRRAIGENQREIKFTFYYQ